MPARKKIARKKVARKKVVRKKAAKKVAKKKKVVRRSGAKRKPNPAFMKPMQPDSALAAVVGDRPQPRTQITKKVWDYIKARGLQDRVNRRMINADDNLQMVFGGKKQVSMFEMTKLVNKHLS
jgi:upstream activation factor subunit UAF30